MNLPYRIRLLSRLGEYMLSDDAAWQEAKEKASLENSWFIPEFITLACREIVQSWLQPETLENWVRRYPFTGTRSLKEPKTIGIIMAGNIPLVGFHDWLSVFISGHRSMVKLSSKDRVLLKHLVEKTGEWEEEAKGLTVFSEQLRGCDAYIATGSNNSSRYFEYYFGKYPHIIRRNRSSVAVLSGQESREELEKLSDDVYRYFGLGCRNVTKIYVPGNYDFLPLLEAFSRYNYLADYHKYRNNYDYNLALHILNKKYYMTNGSLLLVEDTSLFSPIGQLNYEYYPDRETLDKSLEKETDLQGIIGAGHIPFGQAQCPAVGDYADGVDTLAFLAGL